MIFLPVVSLSLIHAFAGGLHIPITHAQNSSSPSVDTQQLQPQQQVPQQQPNQPK